jgi:hypothetical protein
MASCVERSSGVYRIGYCLETQIGGDGSGLSTEVKDRLFEPCFTLQGDLDKELGLPMVFGAIGQHGGTVEVESKLGRGTLFERRLPAEPHGPSSARASLPSWRNVPPMPCGSGKSIPLRDVGRVRAGDEGRATVLHSLDVLRDKPSAPRSAGLSAFRRSRPGNILMSALTAGSRCRLAQ